MYDMHHYLRPLLQKYPDAIILHVGTNNCVNESSLVVLDKIFNLKAFIQNSLPQCKIIISKVINRTDNGKTSLTMGNNGTIIQTGIACKKISRYMRNSACRWLIVENAEIFLKYFEVMLNVLEFCHVREIVES